MKRSRAEREKVTIAAMVRIFCRAHHRTPGALCDRCENLLAYAFRRIDHCKYGWDKPACSQCPVHCYTPLNREAIRTVMRFAGPRMMFYHPWLTFLHYRDAWTKNAKKAPLHKE